LPVPAVVLAGTSSAPLRVVLKCSVAALAAPAAKIVAAAAQPIRWNFRFRT